MEEGKKPEQKLREEKKISFEQIVTASEQMKGLINTARNAAQSEVTVLITGESGTGKELFARAIHNSSPRKDGPVVVVNCAGMPETLLESELFGHEKGAFTDAVARTKGKFELADKGTLFLDEIGDLTPAAQAKTLRAVEEKRFERVGGEEPISVDCRIIAATNKELLKEVKEGHFREDLFYRLNEIHLNILPLRERKEDIPKLIEHFVREFSWQFHKDVKGVSKVTLAYLMGHNWSGNVRELKSIIKASIALVKRNIIWLEDLPFKIQLMDAETIHSDEQDLSLKFAAKEHILNVLNYTKWNKAKASEFLKISRPTLDKKIQTYHLEP